VSEEETVLTAITIVVFASLGVLWMAMANRRAVREMEHRERLAMIQRGLLPAPESDPLGFEEGVEAFSGAALKTERWRTAGTLIVGLGIALTILLTFSAGEFSVGVGVGGAFVALGAAILLNGLQLDRSSSRTRRVHGRRPFADSSAPPMEPPSPLP
jgi:hypothetical protein